MSRPSSRSARSVCGGLRPQRLMDREDGAAFRPCRNAIIEAPGWRAANSSAISTSQKPALPSRASTPSMMARNAAATFLGDILERAAIRVAGARSQPPADAGWRVPGVLQASSIAGSISPALITRGSGRVSVPVLSKTTVSASASRSMVSPELRKMPERNKRAGRHHLNRGNRERQRAGAGDDEHRDRRDQRVMHRRARDQPADQGQRGGGMHHRRIDSARCDRSAGRSASGYGRPCRAAVRYRRERCRCLRRSRERSACRRD